MRKLRGDVRRLLAVTCLPASSYRETFDTLGQNAKKLSPPELNDAVELRSGHRLDAQAVPFPE